MTLKRNKVVLSIKDNISEEEIEISKKNFQG